MLAKTVDGNTNNVAIGCVSEDGVGGPAQWDKNTQRFDHGAEPFTFFEQQGVTTVL